MSNKSQQGTSLIELIIAIVIAGVMLGGLLPVFSSVTSRSADPMIVQQSVLAARAMMEEILLKSYFDPATGTVCPPAPAARAAFDNVCDFSGFTSNGIADQFGNAQAGLSAYPVSVSVAAATGSDALGSIPSSRALKVSVTVDNPLGRPVVLHAWRTCYESPVCSTL